jgi:parvulin-like peptidyl-prolyl isomerase
MALMFRPNAWCAVRLLTLMAVAVLSVAWLTACGEPASSAGSQTPADGDVVVRVDGEGVTRDQIEAVRAEARLSGRGDGADAARDEAVRRVLVRREAARLGIRIADDAVRQRVADLEENAGGAQALEAALERASMTREGLGQAVRYSLLVEAVADAKNADVEASRAAVRAFYDRHRDDLYTTSASFRLGQITVPGEKLADELVRRLRRGASFPELARRYSMDPETRYQDGDIGWVSAFTVPREVLAAVESVAKGGVADPVWSSGKWQVFKVFGRRPARVVPFAEARDPIARELTRRRRAKALDRWLDQEVGRADVVTTP